MASQEGQAYDLFFSHAWGQDAEGRDNHARVLEVVSAVQQTGLRVWVDEAQLAGDIEQEMCSGIDSSDFFVAFVTQSYFEKVNKGNRKDNCCLEFSYAARMGKPMIPVIMKPGMVRQDTWAGPILAHLGGLFYANISDDDIQPGVAKLLDKIAKLREKPAVPTAPKPAADPSPSPGASPPAFQAGTGLGVATPADVKDALWYRADLDHEDFNWVMRSDSPGNYLIRPVRRAGTPGFQLAVRVPDPENDGIAYFDIVCDSDGSFSAAGNPGLEGVAPAPALSELRKTLSELPLPTPAGGTIRLQGPAGGSAYASLDEIGLGTDSQTDPDPATAEPRLVLSKEDVEDRVRLAIMKLKFEGDLQGLKADGEHRRPLSDHKRHDACFKSAAVRDGQTGIAFFNLGKQGANALYLTNLGVFWSHDALADLLGASSSGFINYDEFPFLDFEQRSGRGFDYLNVRWRGADKSAPVPLPKPPAEYTRLFEQLQEALGGRIEAKIEVMGEAPAAAGAAGAASTPAKGDPHIKKKNSLLRFIFGRNRTKAPQAGSATGNAAAAPQLVAAKTTGRGMALPPPPPAACQASHVALHDYKARTADDLSFRRGEALDVVNAADGNWWQAVATTSGRRGYVPSNYLAPPGSLATFSWFAGRVSRTEAGRIVQRAGSATGTFLIRESESQPGDYSLTLLDASGADKHYRIRTLDDGAVYITRRQTFVSVPELVKHYCNAAEASVPLSRPAQCVTAPTVPPARGNQWQVDSSTITLEKKLGAGRSSEVWKGTWNSATTVAFRTGRMDPAAWEERVMAMVEDIKSLIHPRLVPLYGFCLDAKLQGVFVEYMSNGALLDYLHDKGRSLKLPQLIDMAAQVSDGMAYLENRCIAHGDLAARSVLVGANNICKVRVTQCFRLEDRYDVFAREVGDDVAKFPVKWTAPEAAMLNKWSIKSDVWAFGILLTELVTFGRIPYPRQTNAEVLQKVETGYRMPCPADTPQALYDMMLDCWKATPEERPTFETLQWRLEDFFVDTSAGYTEAEQ